MLFSIMSIGWLGPTLNPGINIKENSVSGLCLSFHEICDFHRFLGLDVSVPRQG
jgi:hypothetical protein